MSKRASRRPTSAAITGTNPLSQTFTRARGTAANPRGGAGEQPRARADVHNAHSRLQARIPEGSPAVPGAGPEPHNALEAIVVGGGAIENAAHPCAALAFGAVVRAQWWMRCWHETQLTRACDCTPPAH